ncbi:MAG: iron ABC transporter permease [Chloroflexaceae bacterium]|nr:iron ABC transporter permease [Chloroflexaceae bacterium]
MTLRRTLPIWLALPLLVPIALVAAALLTPTPDIWAHLWATRLPAMLLNTVLLVAGVGAGTLLLGTGLAWLVSAYQFPGRSWFAWLLLLPLAMPGYVLAFIYMATFDFAGPVQTALRAWFGGPVWFPNIRSLGGAILVLTLVLYPYVYLLARTAFREQSASTLDVARAMGETRWRAFWRLVLPLARPALVAGATLAMLEAMTDFATVRFFNVPTLSEGVFRVWEGMMNREAATELAALLLLAALGIMLLERALRGQARYYQNQRPARRMAPVRLRGWRGGAATGACVAVLAVAFGLPLAQLLLWANQEVRRGNPGALDDVYMRYVLTTVSLAMVAAGLAIGLALALSQGTRLSRSRVSRLATRLATLGYAMPGAVIAAGVLLTLASADRALAQVAGATSGTATGLLLTGSVAGLLYAYVVRFMAVAYNSVEASLEKVTPSMAEAARCLGSSPARVLWRVHCPLMRGGLLAGGLLVFVDVMKELPATLLLRPFGMDGKRMEISDER